MIYACLSCSIHVHDCLYMSVYYQFVSCSMHVYHVLFMPIVVFTCPSLSIILYPILELGRNITQQILHPLEIHTGW